MISPAFKESMQNVLFCFVILFNLTSLYDNNELQLELNTFYSYENFKMSYIFFLRVHHLYLYKNLCLKLFENENIMAFSFSTLQGFLLVYATLQNTFYILRVYKLFMYRNCLLL